MFRRHCERSEAIQTPSFRGDAKHRTRNLEIPRCAIAHLRSGPSDHPGMTVSDLPCGLNLRSPNVGEERVDFRTQHVGFAAQLAGRAQHLAGSRSGLRRGGRDADDVAGNLGGAASGVLDVAGDLARRGALLFDGGAIAVVTSLISPMVW